MIPRTAALATLAASVALAVTAAVGIVAAAVGIVAAAPDCEWETGEGQAVCVWHADRQGDGRGDSLLLVGGHVVARW